MTVSKVSVSRGAGSESPGKSVYAVELAASTTVLRALMTIARDQDPTLAFRIHRCYRGTCGSCSVEVNGRIVRACRRLIDEGEEIEVGPDPRYPRVRDLVVDFTYRVKKPGRRAKGGEDET